MKKLLTAAIIASTLLSVGTVYAELVLLQHNNYGLSQFVRVHGNMVLCGLAGDLTLKSTKTETFKPSGKSPTMMLNALLKMGASIEVCPLYLPNAGKTSDELIKGISVAKPPMVAGKLLDTDYRSLTF